MSYEFAAPEFVQFSTPEEIQRRMMQALPEGIDDMPGGFPYDFTMPTAIEKSELIQFQLVRTLMLMFPQYAWGEWLELHAETMGITRRPPGYASGEITVFGEKGTEIREGTVFCTAATDDSPSLEYAADAVAMIGETGTATVPVTAVRPGKESNVKKGTVIFLMSNVKGISSVVNEEEITGGTDEEDDASLFARLELEYASSSAYIGNDSDYIRWAKQVTGVGDCIVIPAWDGPGTVKLVLVDANGEPANEKLVEDVYAHIVSPDDRKKRLLPTACAKLTILPAATIAISYRCTGLVYEGTDLVQIAEDFKKLVAKEYEEAKREGVLIYNQVRALITDIPGVSDFAAFFMNGTEENIVLDLEEYAATGEVAFS